MLRPARLRRGFTLIELMMSLAIFAILFAMALPAYQTWIASNRVRVAAEGLQTGLAIARSEAMRLNRNVEFVITNDAIDLGSVGTVNPAANGIHWLVRYQDSAGTWQLVQSKSGYEGSGRVEGDAINVQLAASAPQIVFRGMGGTQGLGAAATFDLSNPGAGACNTVAVKGPIRCLRVQVSVGGQVRLCDPSTQAGDTRAC